jgi:phytoene dehydrogenase-like protein
MTDIAVIGGGIGGLAASAWIDAYDAGALA